MFSGLCQTQLPGINPDPKDKSQRRRYHEIIISEITINTVQNSKQEIFPQRNPYEEINFLLNEAPQADLFPFRLFLYHKFYCPKKEVSDSWSLRVSPQTCPSAFLVFFYMLWNDVQLEPKLLDFSHMGMNICRNVCRNICDASLSHHTLCMGNLVWFQ